MLAAKGFGSPDETRSFAGKGKMDVINVGGVTAGKGVFEPGWKWSENVKPLVGGDSCSPSRWPWDPAPPPCVRDRGPCLSPLRRPAPDRGRGDEPHTGGSWPRCGSPPGRRCPRPCAGPGAGPEPHCAHLPPPRRVFTKNDV
jgi:hypothetical protein